MCKVMVGSDLCICPPCIEALTFFILKKLEKKIKLQMKRVLLSG